MAQTVRSLFRSTHVFSEWRVERYSLYPHSIVLLHKIKQALVSEPFGVVIASSFTIFLLLASCLAD